MTIDPERVKDVAGKQFPILASWRPGGREKKQFVPWSFVEPHRQQARRNHYQSLERLAERGGLSWSELLAVIEDRPWTNVDRKTAEAAVRSHLQGTTP